MASDPMDSPASLADGLVRVTCAIPDCGLRSSYLRNALLRHTATQLAPILEVLCARAEQAEARPRETLIALVDALYHIECGEAVQRLRREAQTKPYLALERLLRLRKAFPGMRDAGSPDDEPIPDYGKGRPLTLGERKSLARRPDRTAMERLFRDPHPDVIRQVLANPKVVESDVVGLAARRPCRAEVLAEIARQPRWVHRPLIRMALVQNPDITIELAAPLIGLLMRHELRQVAAAQSVAPLIRALCHEHLQRRPPAELDSRLETETLQ